MNAVPAAMQRSKSVLWLAVAPALVAALTYALVAARLLPAGGLTGDGGKAAIMYVAAGCYLVGGLLILLQHRWLWVLGAVINLLVILFFIQRYTGQPSVMFSPAGLATKIPQLLLEAALVYLIFTFARNSHQQK